MTPALRPLLPLGVSASPAAAEIAVQPGWEEVLGWCLEPRGTVMVVGDVNAGKSTLLAWLAAQAVQHGCTAWVVDADVGQSMVGPPTTVAAAPAAALAAASGLGWVAPHALHFVGAGTPQGHVHDCVVGAARMAAEARRQGAELVLVNTTGWVWGDEALALKQAKVEILEPSLVVALERGRELRPLLRGWGGCTVPHVLRLRVATEARVRDHEERAERRRQLWQHYLQPARRVELRLSRVAWGVTGSRFDEQGCALFKEGAQHPTVACSALPPAVQHRWRQGLAVGLVDEANRCLAVGPLVEVDPRGRHAVVLAPWLCAAPPARVVVGSVLVPGYEGCSVVPARAGGAGCAP